MKIKICGITKLEDAQVCVNYGVDAIGFVFYKKSKRYITPSDALNISLKMPPFLHKVGVFVNEEISEVNRIAKLSKLTAVQLHGNESLEYIKEINYPVIKNFGIDENFDFRILNNFMHCGLLLDIKDSKQYGGTGNSFNWDLIPNNIRNKIILAGGVGINNIENIFKTISPYAIDVSSSIESLPGVKDKEKVSTLLKKLKRMNNEYD